MCVVYKSREVSLSAEFFVEGSFGWRVRWRLFYGDGGQDFRGSGRMILSYSLRYCLSYGYDGCKVIKEF